MPAMHDAYPTHANAKPTSFQAAAEEPECSLAGELLLLVRENKKWWLIPILAVLAVVGLLAALGTTGAAPFIYTLF